MTLPVVFTANGSTGYNLTKSLRFRSSASAYLNRTNTTPTNANKWTWSGWVKRGALGSQNSLFGSWKTANGVVQCYFQSNDTFRFYASDSTNTTYVDYQTSAVYRDPSAWYHVVVGFDNTGVTASVNIYVNGTQITSFGTSSNTLATLSSVPFNASGITAYIGQSRTTANAAFGYLDGYQAEINFVDGQQLTPSSFGSTNATTGVWQPAKYTGTYGTNGFYLPFTNTTSTTTLGYDFSGNSNNWTTNNLSLTAGTTYDSMTDVPTLTSATAANYNVLNPIALGTSTLSNGNLTAVLSTTTSTTYSTLGMDSGKWYWEVTYTTAFSNALFVGVNQFGNITTAGSSAGPAGTGGVGYYGFNGNKYVNGGSAAAYGSTFTTGDVIGVALDVGGGTVTFYKNNTSQGSITLPTKTSSWMACFDNGSGGGTQTIAVNFGQQPYVYTPPTGFLALNTYNLPTSTIVKGNTVMDAVTRNGFGSSGGAITSLNFKPDFIWEKTRSSVSDNNLADSVRGSTKLLASNTTSAEATNTTYITGFTSNGYTFGTGDYGTSTTLVDWVWQAGQGTTSSNTNGSITSTVSVNASAGFSVVTWTGTSAVSATIGHGLGVAPKFVIIKQRTPANAGLLYDWNSYHASLGADYFIGLNATGSASSYTVADLWSRTNPSSTVVTLGSSVGTGATGYNVNNYSGTTYVAYCWSEIAGFSKFGSYTGNGSTYGPFIYTGFRPRFVLIKNAGATGDWTIMDTARDTYNAAITSLYPNLANSEGGGNIDILSNGFKIHNTTYQNGNGNTMIYAAFAENPFKNALAR
jgi:hypothetical protein